MTGIHQGPSRWIRNPAVLSQGKEGLMDACRGLPGTYLFCAEQGVTQC
jgi:hypothetical protein